MKWAIVACVRKSYRVGIFDPSRPDFPGLDLSVLQILLSIRTPQELAHINYYNKFESQNQGNSSSSGGLSDSHNGIQIWFISFSADCLHGLLLRSFPELKAIFAKFFHERFSGVVAGQALAHLYQAARPYVNYFQPSFKLRKKVRNGAKVIRSYDQPATPCDRLLKHPVIDDRIKEKLQLQRLQFDPVELLHRIREGQAALTALVSTDSSPQGPGRETLDQFLAQLPRLW